MKLMLLKKYLNWLILLIAAGIFGGYMLFTQHDSSVVGQTNSELEKVMKEDNSAIPEEKNAVPQIIVTKNELYVDVKGEVKHEGVYKVKEGDRVLDVVNMAGGFTKFADKKSVNLAALLKDEMVVYIPKIGENHLPVITNQTSEQSGKGKVNINTAKQEILETLPGIGPSKAAAIVTYREEHGVFQKVTDIMNVPGIGNSTYEHLKASIVVK